MVTVAPLIGLKLVKRQRMGDSRGFLSRLLCPAELSAAGWGRYIAQNNHTHTAMRYTERGMQLPQP